MADANFSDSQSESRDLNIHHKCQDKCRQCGLRCSTRYLNGTDISKRGKQICGKTPTARGDKIGVLETCNWDPNTCHCVKCPCPALAGTYHKAHIFSADLPFIKLPATQPISETRTLRTAGGLFRNGGRLILGRPPLIPSPLPEPLIIRPEPRSAGVYPLGGHLLVGPTPPVCWAIYQSGLRLPSQHCAHAMMFPPGRTIAVDMDAEEATPSGKQSPCLGSCLVDRRASLTCSFRTVAGRGRKMPDHFTACGDPLMQEVPCDEGGEDDRPDTKLESAPPPPPTPNDLPPLTSPSPSQASAHQAVTVPTAPVASRASVLSLGAETAEPPEPIIELKSLMSGRISMEKATSEVVSRTSTGTRNIVEQDIQAPEYESELPLIKPALEGSMLASPITSRTPSKAASQVTNLGAES